MKKLIYILFLTCLLSACRSDCWEYPYFYIHNSCSDTIQFAAPYSYLGTQTILPDDCLEFRGERIGCGNIESELLYIKLEYILGHAATIIFSDFSQIEYSLNDITQTRNPLLREYYSWDGGLTFEYTITEADHQAAKAASAM